MSDITANWQDQRYSSRELELSRSVNSRADRVLARAERRETPASSASRVIEPARMDRMDKLAVLVGAIMAIGPLFAAYVGSLMISP